MPKTLLLADDSVTIQKVVGISFANEDIEIVTVDNGNDAVSKARELHPDVILADVVMPGISGYEVCETLKADPELARIPVVLLTGTFETFDEERAERAGAAGHVSKPFEAQTLVDRVKDLLAAPPPFPETSVPVETAAEPTAMAAEPTSDAEAGFDFFEDSSADLEETPSALAAESDAEALDLDEPDSTFAFGDDDLSVDPLAAPADATVVAMPELGDEDSEPLELGPPAASATSAEPAVEQDDLTRAATLDPDPGSDFDVSSSDLAVDVPPPASPEAFDTPPPPSDVPSLGPDPVMELLATPAAGADAPMLEGAAEPVADDDPFDSLPRPFGVDPESGDDTASLGRAPAELDSEWAEPLDAPAPEFSPPAPVIEAPQASDAPASGEREMSPEMRAELHDTLEKVAWDAFGQSTEKIVRDAIERIERVAWEVVPKLAETLIQEEIRKLKGSGSR